MFVGRNESSLSVSHVCLSQGAYLGAEEQRMKMRKDKVGQEIHPDIATAVVYQFSHEMFREA